MNQDKNANVVLLTAEQLGVHLFDTVITPLVRAGEVEFEDDFDPEEFNRSVERFQQEVNSNIKVTKTLSECRHKIEFNYGELLVFYATFILF